MKSCAVVGLEAGSVELGLNEIGSEIMGLGAGMIEEWCAVWGLELKGNDMQYWGWQYIPGEIGNNMMY